MSEPTPDNAACEIVAPDALCTLEDLCVACNVETGWVVALVEHGVIEPLGRSQSEWQFSSLAVLRVARARRLERDLSLDAPGIALVLELLDEIDQLRARLKILDRRA